MTQPQPERLRILVVHNRYRSDQPSGENQVVDDEVALLSSRHDVDLFERRSDDIATWSTARRATVPLRVVWSPAESRAIADEIERRRPDVVHVHNTFPLISPSVVARAHRLGVPVVATLHNYRLVCAAGTLLRDDAACLECVDHGPARAVRHGCYRGSPVATLPVAAGIAVHRAGGTWRSNVSRFVVMSDLARDLMQRTGIAESAIVVKPHSVPDPGLLRSGPGEGLVFVGRLSHHKGVDLLLDAWEPAMGRITVVGDGEERDALELRARDRGVDVRFLGALPRTEVARHVAAARALVLPSRAFETFGLVAAEAAAVGVPAVVPREGALAEVVVDQATGSLFRSGDVGDLRRALQELGDPETSIRLGGAARQRYLERYTPERNLEALDALYRRVVAGG